MRMIHTGQRLDRLIDIKVAVPQALSNVRIRKSRLLFGPKYGMDVIEPGFHLRWKDGRLTKK